MSIRIVSKRFQTGIEYEVGVLLPNDSFGC